MNYDIKSGMIHFRFMFDTSARTLRFLASLLWYIGAIVLSFKGIILLLQAQVINPDKLDAVLVVAGGLLFGVIKAKYLFSKICLKNLKRIDALKKPKLWEFYRLRFFIFLLTMIMMARFISQQAQGNYSMLNTMGLIEISLATALLGSSFIFWKK